MSSQLIQRMFGRSSLAEEGDFEKATEIKRANKAIRNIFDSSNKARKETDIDSGATHTSAEKNSTQIGAYCKLIVMDVDWRRCR